ncbi:MAG: T9SS type A sorting domain-containing protein [Flavobacteriales bacterium]|nr:T9SS type A sorting domain-containing protein [Flavobacteriales bacterium]
MNILRGSVIGLALPLTLSAQPGDPVVPTMNQACAVGYVNLFGGLFNLGPDCATYSGTGSCPPGSGPMNGVHGNWRGPNAVGWLIGRLDELYAVGLRKVMVNRPMGGSGVSHVTGAAWLTLPEYKRAQLTNELQPWLAAHPDLILGIFIGSRWIALDSLMGYRDDMGPYPGTTSGFDPLLAPELDAWHQVVDPWFAIGVRWVVLDAASMPANRDWFLRLAAYEADLRQVEITAEAITNSATHHAQASWIALAPTYIDHPSRPHTQAGPDALIDAATTWYAWLQLSGIPAAYANGHIPSDDPQAYIQSIIARGYVPMATASEFQTYPELLDLVQTCDLTTTVMDPFGSADPVTIHPNPTNGLVTIVVRDVPARFVVHDIIGRPLDAGVLRDAVTHLDLSALQAGSYFFTIGRRTLRIIKD